MNVLVDPHVAATGAAVLSEVGTTVLQVGTTPVLVLVLIATGVAGASAYLSYQTREQIQGGLDAGSGSEGGSDGETLSKIRSLESRLDEIDDRQADRLDRLGDQLDGLETGGADVGSELSSLSDRLQAVEAAVSEVDGGSVDLDRLETHLAKLDHIDDLERQVAQLRQSVESMDAGGDVEVDPESIDLDLGVEDRMDDLEERVASVQQDLSDVADAQTVKQPLVNIDDRLAQIDERLSTLPDDGQADIDSVLSTIDTEISAIDDRLDEIEEEIRVSGGGGGGGGTVGGISTESSTTGFMTDDDEEVEDLEEVEEDFDFGEGFLGVDDEDTT